MIKILVYLAALATPVWNRYNPHTIITRENVLQLNIDNFQKAIDSNKFLFVFVYGQWCPTAKEKVKTFKNFAKHLFYIKSKFVAGIIHTDNAKPYKEFFLVEHNPTLLIYLNGKLVRNTGWEDNKKYYLDLMKMDIMHHYENEYIDTMSEFDFDDIKKNQKLSLVYIGDNQSENYNSYLDMVLCKKHEEFQYFRIEASQTYDKDSVYLYRSKDDVIMKVEPFPNFSKSMKWLYHHSEYHLIDFPQPALTHILDHKNTAIFLFMKSKKDLLDKNIEHIEVEFENAAEKLYKSFKMTKCFLDEDEKCKNFFVEDLKGDISLHFPRIIVAIHVNDFRSQLLGLRYSKDLEITDQNIINFARNFHNEELNYELLTEEEDPGNEQKLVAKNMYLKIRDNEKIDRIIFYYRGGIQEDLDFLEQLKDFFEENMTSFREEILFFHYDGEKNSLWKDFNSFDDLPALQIFQKFNKIKRYKLLKKVSNFDDMLYYMNDHMTEDNSMAFINFRL